MSRADGRGRAESIQSPGTEPTYAPRKRPNVLELDMGDGVILYDPESSLVHHLNVPASIVWHLCDGGASADRLAEEISEEYGLGLKEIRRQITDLFAELDALGLVEDSGAAAGADAASVNGSRPGRADG